jgi:hypothetical protein
MSFFRHEKIYHFDVRPNWQGDSTATLPAHRYDEFSAGYSLAGCAPAEPPSASPANCSFLQLVLVGNTLPANSNLSLFTVSQDEGAVQSTHFPFSPFQNEMRQLGSHRKQNTFSIL